RRSAKTTARRLDRTDDLHDARERSGRLRERPPLGFPREDRRRTPPRRGRLGRTPHTRREPVIGKAADRPIGAFASGVGGLTIGRELWRRLPSESVVYFGDTARVPYGPKAPATIRRYAREAAAFLLAHDVKMIVIACNTATAHAVDE